MSGKFFRGVLAVFAIGAISWGVFELFFAIFMGDLDGNSGTELIEQRSFEALSHGITHLGLGLLAFGLNSLLDKLSDKNA